ncbi:unnamed protein product [Phaeothamnion confervicola]
MACCLLLRTGESRTAADAMDLYDGRRVSDGRGLTVINQRKFVYLYALLLSRRLARAPLLPLHRQIAKENFLAATSSSPLWETLGMVGTATAAAAAVGASDAASANGAAAAPADTRAASVLEEWGVADGGITLTSVWLAWRTGAGAGSGDGSAAAAAAAAVTDEAATAAALLSAGAGTGSEAPGQVTGENLRQPEAAGAAAPPAPAAAEAAAKAAASPKVLTAPLTPMATAAPATAKLNGALLVKVYQQGRERPMRLWSGRSNPGAVATSGVHEFRCNVSVQDTFRVTVKGRGLRMDFWHSTAVLDGFAVRGNRDGADGGSCSDGSVRCEGGGGRHACDETQVDGATNGGCGSGDCSIGHADTGGGNGSTANCSATEEDHSAVFTAVFDAAEFDVKPKRWRARLQESGFTMRLIFIRPRPAAYNAT